MSLPGLLMAVLLGLAQDAAALPELHLTRLLDVEGPVLDVGLADVTGDGRSDVVLLRLEAVELYQFEENRPELSVRYRLDHLPQERIRTRDPRGRLTVADFNRDGRAEIFYRSFQRRPGEILAWTGSELRPVRRFERVPLCVVRMAGRPLILFGQPEAGTNYFQPRPELCDINEPRGRRIEITAAFWDLRCLQPEGAEAPWMLWVDREARLHRGETDEPLADVESGMGMAPADLDGDGQPEYVLSDPVWPGAADALVVRFSTERQWSSRDIPGSIRAVSAEDGKAGASRVLVLSCELAADRCRVFLLER